MDIEWFKSRKKAQRVTDADIAAAMGVERSVVNKVMNGKMPLPAYRADKIAQLLEVTPEEILWRAGVPISPPLEMVNASVLTATFALLLDSLGIPPHEDERAQKLALSFPSALKRVADARALAAGVDLPPAPKDPPAAA